MKVDIIKTMTDSRGAKFTIGDTIQFILNRSRSICPCTGIITDIRIHDFDLWTGSGRITVKYSEVQNDIIEKR